jgi:carbonic anhydrase
MARIAFIPAVFLALLLGAAASFGQALTPEKALDELKQGNKRYVAGKSIHGRIDAQKRELTAAVGQKPIVTVLGCSDSRVPVELVFDQGFAQVFVIRVAGNVCGTAELASAEYGCKYLGTPLLVVLGHTKCGAVAGTVSGAALKGSLPKLVEMIQPAVDQARKESPKATGDELVELAVKDNVWHTISTLLKESPVLRRLVKDHKLMVVGAVRDLQSGAVTWLGEHPNQKSLLAAE